MAPRVHSDFVSTYIWLYIAVFIMAMIGVGAVFFWPSAPAFVHSCTIVSGFTCVSATIGYYSGGSVLFLKVTNRQGYRIALSENAVSVHPYIGNKTSYYGGCVPAVVANGADFLCITYINGYSPKYGTTVSPGFTMAYSVGGGGYSVSGTTQVTVGQTMQQAANDIAS